MTTRTLRLAAILTAVTLLTSGCGLLTDGLRGVTLPGGADLGDRLHVRAAAGDRRPGRARAR